MTLRGADGFRRRLNAVATAGQSVARRWAEEDVRLKRSRIRNRTGETSASIRVGSVSPDGATVVGSPVVTYLAGGTQAHEIRPDKAKALRFQIGGRTIFSKKVLHPATQGDPALRATSRDALDDSGFADEVIDLWNGAA